MTRRYRQEEAERRWGNHPTVEARQAAPDLMTDVMHAMAALGEADERISRAEASGEDPQPYIDLMHVAYARLSSLSDADREILFYSVQPGNMYGDLYAGINSLVGELLNNGFVKKVALLTAASVALGPAQLAAADTFVDPRDNASTTSTYSASNRQNNNGNGQPDPGISDRDNDPNASQITNQPNAQPTTQPAAQPTATSQFEAAQWQNYISDPNQTTNPAPAETAPQAQTYENPQWGTNTLGITEVNDTINQATRRVAEASRGGQTEQYKTVRKSVESTLGSIAGLLVTEPALGAAPAAHETSEQNNSPETRPALAAYKPLLKLIGRFESGNSYNAYFRDEQRLGRLPNVNFTRMTVGQVMEWQRGYKARGSRSTAVGYYQFLLDTLDGLVDQSEDIGLDTKFNAETQDKLATMLLKRRGLNQYLSGKISAEEFAHRLSQEWASFPNVIGKNYKNQTVSPNVSYYGGDGLNKEGDLSVRDFLNIIKAIKSHKKTVTPNPSANNDNQNQEPVEADPIWNFPPVTETNDPFPITTEQDPAESSITGLLGKTWEGVTDWLGQNNADEVRDPEILDTPTLLPQESHNDGSIKGFLTKMFGGDKTRTPELKTESNHPRSTKAILTERAIERAGQSANEATQQARIAFAETYLVMADDVDPMVPRNNPVRVRDPDLNAMLREAGYSTSRAYDTPGYDCQKTIKTALDISGVDKDYAMTTKNGRAEYMNTTALHAYVLAHEVDGVTNAGGATQYEVIYRPKKKDLVTGDILLGPGHTAVWVDEVKFKGKTYPMAEAARGSMRVPSLRTGKADWNYISGLRGYLALRVIVPDNVDQY